MSELEHGAAPPAVPLRHRWTHALASLLGKRFDHVLDGISEGQLLLTWPDGHTTRHGNWNADPDSNANLVLHNWQPLTHLLRAGEVGFAESYLRGDWSSDNLPALFLLAMRNEQAIAHALSGGPWAHVANLFNHWNNRNSVRGSRKNIAYHYDLGNAFYELWLDRSMNYSSGLFEHETMTLADAQFAKLDRVAHHLQAVPGARVLEIGCGWGALARRLAEGDDCRVEGISLSREQIAHAQAHHGVVSQDRGSTEFRYQDYRAIEGRYDHIVSIEMLEAVGERYWSVYFDKLATLLDGGGSAVIQVITILEERFEAYRSHPDFIQRYIFPGGMLPTRTRLIELATGAGFRIVATDWFGPSYARTLACWRERFDACSREVLALGFDDRFLRMWRYYLAYCEAGFRSGRTDVGLLVLKKR